MKDAFPEDEPKRMAYGVADSHQCAAYSFGPLIWSRAVVVVDNQEYHTYSIGFRVGAWTIQSQILRITH